MIEKISLEPDGDKTDGRRAWSRLVTDSRPYNCPAVGRPNCVYKVWRYFTINAKKHSLSHQLTAQLHIENSKNKKMVITLLQHIA